MRLPLTLLFIALASTGSADKRGQVVCGIPPDEAVAYVYESEYGGWDYIGPLGRIPGGPSHPTAEAAVAWHAPEQAEYVCDVDILAGQLRLVHTARLYRLHHPFIPAGAVNEYGEPLDYDYDPRQNIVGAPEVESAAAPYEDLSRCITETREESWNAQDGELLQTLLTNSCPSLVFVRYCVGPHLIELSPGRLLEDPGHCVDRWIEPGETQPGTFALYPWEFLDWDFRWAACAGGLTKSAQEHPCYFEP